MAEALHRVDLDSCRGDGICIDVCPQDVLELLDGKASSVEERQDHCILCGHCVAVCPTDSLVMPKLPLEDFEELSRRSLEYVELLTFLQGRRSVREFKNRPVEQEKIDKILAAAATAPMGMPPHSTEVLVIDQREELDFLLAEMVKDYDSVLRAFSNPLGRAMMRVAKGAEIYGMLKCHVVDVAKYANAAYREDGTDRYMYRAPVLMLFHGNRWAMSYEENAHLVCHHAMLAALSLGLGTTIIGLVPPIVDRSKTLRSRYDIPKDNKVLTSLIVGYPKYRYKKSIRRDFAGVQMM